MNFKNVLFKVENHVAYVSVNNPPANALNSDMITGVKDCFEYLSKDEDVKVVVLTGEGKFFVAGADIKEFTKGFDNTEIGESMAEAGQELCDKIEQMEKPVIAAINGACLGGGLELAMGCHLRIAANEAKIGLPELTLGLIPGFGGTQRLSRLTNKAKALELILTSEFVNGEEAANIGLVNLSVPLDELTAVTKKLAESIALKKSLPSINAAVQAVNQGFDMSQSDGLALEAKLFGQMFGTDDMKEGVNAFLEKRSAVFHDK
ncbi:enoyl-CoA hydratase [Virgibacillus byunsanensis]|uniref:Enoyl-CoA hydratase n=1 Tax=Virgibacillus byunsanensis TaxID=570945 RepID=A0ABW3LM65_9BACI